MGGSASTEAVQTTVGPLYDKFEVVRIVGFFVLKKAYLNHGPNESIQK